MLHTSIYSISSLEIGFLSYLAGTASSPDPRAVDPTGLLVAAGFDDDDDNTFSTACKAPPAKNVKHGVSMDSQILQTLLKHLN